MDSGNSSGSMQSSSGGDEEYDSRADPNVAAFLMNPSAHFGSLSNLQQPHQHHQLQSQSQSQSPLYDDPSTIFGGSASTFLNLDAFRSGGLRSRHDCTDLSNNLPGSSTSSPSASSSSSRSILAAHQGSSQGPLSSAAQLQSVAHDDHHNASRSSQPSDQTHHHHGALAPRNPKKRTRASRRAPTTVLTTDTSNFRAMVQEFTGIPAPPFSAGSPYSLRRIDPFGPVSSLRSSHLEPLGSIYPLRPSAQKVHHQQSQFVSSPHHSFLNKNNLVTTANNNNTIRSTAVVTTTSSSNPSTINYQLPSDLGGLPDKQPQNMIINMQNQMLPFQSLLPLQSSFNVPTVLGAKSAASNLPLPSFEELGVSHGHVNPNLNGLPGHHVNMWRHHGSEQDQLRPFDVNYSNPQRANNYSSSASSADFHHDKGLENASTRGQGTVDPWICPSAE